MMGSAEGTARMEGQQRHLLEGDVSSPHEHGRPLSTNQWFKRSKEQEDPRGSRQWGGMERETAGDRGTGDQHGPSDSSAWWVKPDETRRIILRAAMTTYS